MHPGNQGVLRRMSTATSQGKKRFAAYWVVGPLLLYMAIFSFLPIVAAGVLSFFKASPIDVFAAKFVGLRNYTNLFGEADFASGLINTVMYVLLRCGIGIPIALLIAVPLSRAKRLRQLYTASVFMPVMFSSVAATLVFAWLFQPQYGMINPILHALGMDPGTNLGFFTDGNSFPKPFGFINPALLTLVLLDCWHGVGFATVLFLNALLGVPESFYEAARVDGARELQVFRHVTVPLISRTTLFVMVTQVLGAFKVFEMPEILSGMGGMGGMPGNSGRFLSRTIYRSISDYRLGHACAVGIVFLAMVLVVTIFQMRLMRTDWEY